MTEGKKEGVPAGGRMAPEKNRMKNLRRRSAGDAFYGAYLPEMVTPLKAM